MEKAEYHRDSGSKKKEMEGRFSLLQSSTGIK
jgi:hypothetical protein